MSMITLTFDPPGPGSWSIDAVHFARPFSRFQAEIHPPNLAEGFTECLKRYGLLLETLEYGVVNGFAYSTPRPAPASEIPERFEAAARAFETRLWRDDIARWDLEVKPTSIRDHLRLQKVDVSALSDEALLEHIDACREHLKRMVRQHHAFNAAAILPIGDFMAHMAKQGAIGFIEGNPARLSHRIIGLCDIDRDHAIVVTGHHLRPGDCIGQETEC